MPEHLRIPVARSDLWQNRIAAIRSERPAICAMGDALCRRRIAANLGVKQYNGRLPILAEPAGVLPVHHCRTAGHAVLGVGSQSRICLLPVNQVFAHRMSPALPALDLHTEGIVLKAQMIFEVDPGIRTSW